MKPVKKKITSVNIVIRQKSKYLFLQNKSNLLHTLVGGKVEAKDSCLEDAMRRELLEEVGINAHKGEIGKVLETFVHTRGGGLKRVALFFLEIPPGTKVRNMEPEKHVGLIWMSARELAPLLRVCYPIFNSITAIAIEAIVSGDIPAGTN